MQTVYLLGTKVHLGNNGFWNEMETKMLSNLLSLAVKCCIHMEISVNRDYCMPDVFWHQYQYQTPINYSELYLKDSTSCIYTECLQWR